MEGFALDSFQTGKAAQAWRDASLLLTQAARSVVYQAELDTRTAATLALMVRDHLLQLLPLEKEAVRKATLLPWWGPLLFNGLF